MRFSALFLLLASASPAFCDPPADLAPFLKTPSAPRAWGEPVVVPQRGARAFTPAEMESWIAEAVAAVNFRLGYELLDLDAFKARLSARGARPDFSPGARYPTAELSEEGRLLILRDFCNDGNLSEQGCRGAVFALADHENQIYLRWSKMKADAPTAEAFRVKWSDAAHRRCREAEAYVNQVLAGAGDPGLLRGREVAAHAAACRASRWASEFRDSLSELANLARR